jgi:Flp pilus assembly protein TadG
VDPQKIIRQKGQSLVEFALVLPMLLLLVLAAMDIGRLFYMKMVITNAAREGANYLAYYPKDEFDNGCANTYTAITNEGDSSGIQIDLDEDVPTPACCSSLCVSGNQVEVTINKEIDLILDNVLIALGLLGGPIELTSSTIMVAQ